MKRPYHTLLVRFDGHWSIEFGDYDRETVQAELEDYLDHDHKRRDLKIITTSAAQADVAAAVAKLNEGA